MKIRKVKETSKTTKTMKKITDFIEHRYGSIHAFKLLKYFLEHKLARESKGYAVYELTFNIAPSAILTPFALIKIECIADKAEQKDAEAGFDLLIQKGILKIDPDTNILELKAPLGSIANMYLKENDSGLEVAKDKSLATVILLSTSKRQSRKGKKGTKINVAGVPDILHRDKRGRFTITELKFGVLPTLDDVLSSCNSHN